jgi:hypothetical protein
MRSSRAGTIIALAGAVLIASATLFPTPGAPAIPHGCVICGPFGAVDSVLNVLLFIPLGFGLGLRRTALGRALLLVLCATTLVEGLQLTVITGRSATLGDLLTNTLGGSFGYTIGRRWRQIVFPGQAGTLTLLAAAVAGFIVVEVLTGVSLQPYPSSDTYFGQYTRRHRDEPPFPGTVQSAAVGACEIPNWTLVDAQCVRDAVTRADTVTATVAAKGTTMSPTAIVRVADGHQREITMLGADRDRAIFSVRTRAGAMGFRPYRFALDSVFADGSQRVVGMKGHFTPSSALISTVISDRPPVPALTRRAEMRLGPGSGWRLLTPFRFYDRGSLLTRAADAAWLAILVFPIGYWSVLRPARSPWRATAVLPLIGAAMLVGWILFDTAPPSPLEWIVAAAGFGAGTWARREANRVDTNRSPTHD